MKVTEIAFTCYAVANLPKAREFYEGVLGLTPGNVWEKDGLGFIEYEIGQHTLAIGAGAPAFKPGILGATVALEVDDFDGFVKKLRAAKVAFSMEPHDSPVCRMTLVNDYDGNQVMIHQRKKKA